MRALIFACLLAAPAKATEKTIILQLTFDPATLSYLINRGEGVVIAANYAGEPNMQNTLPPDEMGQISIGSEIITIRPENRTVTIGERLGGLALGMTDQPMVNINVYSARWTFENNLLDCDIVDGPVADIIGTTQRISCTLIGG